MKSICMKEEYYMVVAIFLLGMVFFVLIIMASDGAIGKDTMRNTKNIRSGAKIVSVTPKRYGSKGASHYEVLPFPIDLGIGRIVELKNIT